MKLSKFAIIFSIVSLALGNISTYGQDLIARQAPIDRRLKIADSVSISHLRNMEETYRLESLYPEWSNEYVHHYPSSMIIPDTFRIDLRRFCMPTPSQRVTSNYGYRRAYRRMHKGLDVKVYIGDTIRSTFDGKVRIVKYEAGGYGKYVVIRHPNGLETVYGHLSKQLVAENQEVKVGEPIGLGGNTGRSSGSHLHFEVRFMGMAINPALMFDFPNQDIITDYFTFRKDGNYDGQTLAAASSDAPVVETASRGMDIGYHKVKKGENLSVIARKLHTSVSHLCSQNRITKKTRLRPGQILRYVRK